MKEKETVILIVILMLSFSLQTSAEVEPNTISNDLKNMMVKDNTSWINNLLAPVIVGLVVLGGQSLIAPNVAERVRTAESLLERRYEACASAVDVLQRRLVSVPANIKNTPGYQPSEESPTQLEANVVYTLLSIYGTSASVANKFKEVFLCRTITAKDVGEFVSQIRSEMKVKGPKLDPKNFSYIWSIKFNK